MRDELPELITNTDFDVAITYALKLSGVRSILVRPTSSSQSRQASRRDSIRSQRVWMDEKINRITAASPLGDRSIDGSGGRERAWMDGITSHIGC